MGIERRRPPLVSPARFLRSSCRSVLTYPSLPPNSGDRMERERNIIKNRPSYRSLDRDRQQEATNLVSRMVTFDSRARSVSSGALHTKASHRR
jgi:hypothetical protein